MRWQQWLHDNALRTSISGYVMYKKPLEVAEIMTGCYVFDPCLMSCKVIENLISFIFYYCNVA